MSINQTLKNSTLASYAVMKSLTDSNEYHNSYELLADFIRYIIVDRRLYSFSAIEISGILSSEFGFDNIPIPAVNTSIKQIKECKKNGADYVVPRNISFKTDEFQRARKASAERSQHITQKLFEFAADKDSGAVWGDALEDAFIKYLLDDTATIDHKYSDIISKFVLNVESDATLKAEIEEVREGSILYSGLAYNISELGSITNELTLFLDTEVLFNIAGYNGDLYKRMADDFLAQIHAANAKHRIIHLKYFEEVKHEIEGFFISAENIVRGHWEFTPSTAMKAILNGCKTVSDIVDKEADFFHKLQYKYGITCDDKSSYYGSDDIKFNDETIPENFPKDEKSFEAVKFTNHILKLRGGDRPTDYTKCKYLLVTETRRVQELSNFKRENTSECGCAVPVSVITNVLWFKLGSGFSKKQYPINTDALYKAKRILAGELFNNITRVYNDAKNKYSLGQLDKEQIARRIVLLHDKSLMPDDITDSNVDDVLDFSKEYIEKFENEIKYSKVKSEEKDRVIASLQEREQNSEQEKALLQEKLDKATQERDNGILKSKEQEETIQKQNAELQTLRADKKKREKRKTVFKRIGIFFLKTIVVATALILAVYVVKLLFQKINPEYADATNSVIDIVGVVIFIIGAIKWAWKSTFKKTKKS